MKVLLLDEASAQFEVDDAWWRENRDHKYRRPASHHPKNFQKISPNHNGQAAPIVVFTPHVHVEIDVTQSGDDDD